MRFALLFAVGVIAGAFVTLASILNASLGKRAGDLGSAFIVALVSIAVALPFVLFVPGAARLSQLPGVAEWYLYLGGALGLAIVLAPILLVPRIGVTATLTAVVVGQLLLAVILDHFGVLGLPKTEITPLKLLGLALLIAGTFLVVRR